MPLFLYTQRYLKQVDRFNKINVSVYITPGNVRFVLLHDSKNDDGIKAFFTEVHELYVKTLLNPFYEFNSNITSTVFDGKVLGMARRHL